MVILFVTFGAFGFPVAIHNHNLISVLFPPFSWRWTIRTRWHHNAKKSVYFQIMSPNQRKWESPLCNSAESPGRFNNGREYGRNIAASSNCATSHPSMAAAIGWDKFSLKLGWGGCHSENFISCNGLSSVTLLAAIVGKFYVKPGHKEKLLLWISQSIPWGTRQKQCRQTARKGFVTCLWFISRSVGSMVLRG